MFWCIEPVSKMCDSRRVIMSPDIIRIRNPECSWNAVNVEHGARFFHHNRQVILENIVLFYRVFNKVTHPHNIIRYIIFDRQICNRV